MNSGKRKNNTPIINDKKVNDSKKKTSVDKEIEELDIDGLVFEDPFEDEYEEEEYDETLNDDEDEYEDIEDDEANEEEAMKIDTNNNVTKQNKGMSKDTNSKASKNLASTSTPSKTVEKSIWRPGVDKLEEDEELEYDPSAYVMYHSIQTEWPCLSFDFIRDHLGDNRQRFPLSMLLVTGSQADRSDRNKITLLKLSDVHKTKLNHDDDEDSDDDDDEDDDEDDDLDDDPVIEDLSIPHIGGINRIRSMPQMPGVIATMSETSHTHIYDMSIATKALMSLNTPHVKPKEKPVFTFKGHQDEGFAIDWSPATLGRLATGDNKGNIYIWNAADATGSSWSIDSSPFAGHTNSVEDIQWSPSEATVFISASSDKTCRVWDIRGKTGPQITFQAHNSDVNVISWNRSVNYLLASGSDDGSFKVWDLRAIRNKCEPLAHFTYHKHPITSIEWAPHDESVLCCSSEDDQITVWDLSVEADDQLIVNNGNGRQINKSSTKSDQLDDFPSQLLFIHQGQKDVKEIHYHPQIPGVIMSSAENCIDLFKPAINVLS